MPLFATCTIANAILALCAPPGTLTFSSWVRTVPLRFDTLASYKLARRIPGVRYRALHCVPVSRCNAGGSVRALACHAAVLVCAVPGRRSGASVRLVVWPRKFGRRSATATVRRCIWLAPWAKLSMRTISMDLTGHWRSGMVRRTRRGDGTAQCLPHQQSSPDGLRHVCARAARQRAALRLAAAIVQVAHDSIANP